MPQVQRPHERGSNGGGGFSQKKKFGKNLNKLVKSAPPIPNDKSDLNAKNGLLLLSTKKTTSGLLASKTNTTISSGIGGTNGASIKNSSASTHDALLSAVIGAAQIDAHQKPDAWGVAEQAKGQQHIEDVMEEQKNNREHNSSEQQYSTSDYDEYHDHHRHDKGSSWDEYGGRNGANREDSSTGKLVEVDDQVEYMARLAKERAKARSREEEARVAEQKSKAAQRLEELDQKKGSTKGTDQARGSGARSLWEPDEKNGTKNSNGKESSKSSIVTPKSQKPREPTTDPENLIHLASYDDRDRGERTAAVVPRMLYDPKSGSMIEVKSRGESGGSSNSNTTNRRKERRPKPAKGKDRRETAAVEVALKNGRNKQKGRKDASVDNHSPDKKKANPTRRFPRTCGVLYRRDNKGNFQTADDCEGDLGYGAHSVPGGRANNPDAYTAWYEEKEAAYEENGYDDDIQGVLDFGGDEYGVGLETGFNAEEEPQPLMEWIKADDKIELVTGMDDSPTLKPTAKIFAPSQAALAAATGTPTQPSDEFSESGDDIDVHDESEEDEDSEEPDDGLGFDPLQGIDFMSHSPPQSPTADDIAAVDLPALALDPPMFAGAQTEEVSRPFFAFGSSDTWGNGQPSTTTGLSGWGSDPVSAGLFGSDVFRNGEKESEPSHFLGSPSGSWGPATVPGLDRLPTINAEHTTGPAD